MLAIGRAVARSARRAAALGGAALGGALGGAALGVRPRVAHRAADFRGPVPRFSTIPDNTTVPVGAIGPIGPDGLPTYVDWNRYGAVTPVQDQGEHCGCCWAFGTTALIEGVHFIKNHKIRKLSEQQLVDANNMRNWGCEGGSVAEGLRYVMSNGGLLLEKDYPYVGRQCHARPITAEGVTIQGYDTFHQNHANERVLKYLVAAGPVAVSVGCDEKFAAYQEVGVGTILYGPDYTLEEMEELGIGHAVVVVGYGETLFGEKFWLVKSSHGGELMLVAREIGLIGGAFGIARSLVTINKTSEIGLVTVRTDEEMGVPPRLLVQVEDDF